MAMVQLKVTRLNQFLALLLMLILFQCENDEPFLKITGGSFEVPDSRSLSQIVIAASGSWSASVDQAWVKLSQLSGTGTVEVGIIVEANPLPSVRSATITVEAVSVPETQTLVITQGGSAPTLDISRTTVTFPALKSGDTLRIISNDSWTVADDQEWLTITPTSGNGIATLTLNAEKNTSISSREATVTIVASGPNVTKRVAISQNGAVSIVAGGNGSGPSPMQLNNPSSLWGDNKGNIFITDQFNDRVVKWPTNSSAGSVAAGSNSPGSSLSHLYSPYGIFVDNNGDMFIGDNVNNRVLKWTPGDESGILIAGGNGSGSNTNQTNSPCGVYIDGNGDVFVAEAGIHRVAKWTAGATSGILIAQGAAISFTTALTLDKDGNVYIASGDNSNVTKWVPGANEGVVVAGGNGRGAGLNQLNGPSGIFLADDGSIYISDQGNDRVVKWLPGATTGMLVAGGHGRGSELTQLNSPSGLWLDDKGYIYVSDQANHRIVRWLE